MRKIFLSLFVLVVAYAGAQVTTDPAILVQGYSGQVTLTFDPTQGNGGMVGATECYLYSCVQVDNRMDGGKPKWEYQLADWPSNSPKTKMTKDGNNWKLVISNLNAFYGIRSGETITKMLVLFTDGKSGGKAGRGPGDADIIIDLVEPGQLSASINTAMPEISALNSSVSLICNATESATLTLKQNGQVVKTGTGTELTYNTTLGAVGDYVFEFTATNGAQTATAKASTCVPTSPTRQNRPAGIVNGIYYNSDPSKITLCTYASSKTQAAQHVFVVGDFNDWTISNAYQLKQANDSAYFWIELNNLTPKREYAFQYVVMRADGVIKHICDLYSEKVLTRDDEWEPRDTDPTLREYPAQADGSFVSVFETGKDPYQWKHTFQRPNKNNLVIYETWLYDFTPSHNFAGMMERLDYIENLGVNAIEFMPITECDGNNGWGYSPCLYFAIDKTFGTPTQFKELVDECHRRGIAVIMDMVFNHATGNNPMNRLYPKTGKAGEPEFQQNPWFNYNVPHGDNVYEDWNHDFGPTHQMFIRALKYWIREYHVDGYRLDLSHGLCGPTDNAVANLIDYYNKGVKAADPNAYLILEHWGKKPNGDMDWAQQDTLANRGMLPWAKNNYPFAQIAMGYTENSSISGANKDKYISYSESHDEERNMAKVKLWGASDLKTNEDARVKRTPLVVGLLTMLNGSKMLYHFEELGFDYSKFQNKDGYWGKDNEDGYPGDYGNPTPKIAEDVKMQPKHRPEPWMRGGVRMEAYQKVAQIIQLRTRIMPEVFEGDPTNSAVGATNLRTIQWGSNVFVCGNMSATATQNVSLPSGTWYDYLGGGTNAAASYTLQPGEIKVFTGSKIVPPVIPASYDYSEDIDDIIWEDTSGSAYKVVRNGQVLIVRGDHVYTITGARVQ